MMKEEEKTIRKDEAKETHAYRWECFFGLLFSISSLALSTGFSFLVFGAHFSSPKTRNERAGKGGGE